MLKKWNVSFVNKTTAVWPQKLLDMCNENNVSELRSTFESGKKFDFT